MPGSQKGPRWLCCSRRPVVNLRDNELIRHWLGEMKSQLAFFEGSLWSLAAGACGAQPRRQPVSVGGWVGALLQLPTATAREILLGVAGFNPISLSPRAHER